MTWLIFKLLKYVYFKDCINHSDTNKGTLKVPNLLIKEEIKINKLTVFHSYLLG
jgi:hypothetical protein